jgi:serine/threonine protein kinase
LLARRTPRTALLARRTRCLRFFDTSAHPVLELIQELSAPLALNLLAAGTAKDAAFDTPSSARLASMRTAVQTVGEYELLDKIAEGGMGTVYRARQRSTGATVALKLVPAPLASSPILIRRFRKEYEAASRLDHPNIVRALDFGYHGDLPYMVMEFVEGESLGQRLAREGRLSEREAVRIIAQVAQGLHRAHQSGLVHRDVKPDNILLTPDGQAKLADLGLVKEVDAELNLTRTGRGLGTPHFMAPEQFRDAKNADVRCDIYSLGATLYMMVTGELPFKSLGPVDAWMNKLNNNLRPARDIVPELSERLSWAIARAMSADRERRPASCREFLEDLTGHSTRKLTPPPGMTTVPDLWYVTYHDRDGVLHAWKGNSATLRKNLKEGMFTEAQDVRASRTRSGPFEPLRNHPEFRDLVLAAAPLTPQPGQRPPTPTAPPRAVEPIPPVNTAALPVAATPPAPHIELGAGGGQNEWAKWLLLFLGALSAGLAALYLLPLR